MMVQYWIGETREISETVKEDDNTAIMPSSASAKLYNKTADAEIATLTVETALGRVTTTIGNTQITAEGQYQVEWQVTYTSQHGTPAIVKFFYTDIVADYRDSTYLMRLVPQLRVLTDDDPEDLAMRKKTDDGWKKIMVEAVRYFMANTYSLTTNAQGQHDVTPTPTAGSDSEKLIALWAAYFYYVLHAVAIARERTQIFEVSYDQAYAQVKDRVEFVKDRIDELDEAAAMQFLSETEFQLWGSITQRHSDAIAAWGDN